MFLYKIRILFLILIFSLSVSSRADEGMWLPNLISTMNIDDMQSNGLSLSAEDIYSVNKSSLKDAVVALSWGSCTGEIIAQLNLWQRSSSTKEHHGACEQRIAGTLCVPLLLHSVSLFQVCYCAYIWIW